MRGCAIERVITRARDGATLMNLNYADMQPELRALGIRRPALAELLHEAARAAGAAIHFGVAIEKFSEEPDHVSLLERGSAKTHGPFDLALVCNGLNSRLRDSVSPGAKVRPHARGVFSVVAALPASLSSDVLLQSLNGMRDGVGMLPIGCGDGTTPLVSFFWNARASELPRLEAEGYGAVVRVHRRLLSRGGRAAAQLQRIRCAHLVDHGRRHAAPLARRPHAGDGRRRARVEPATRVRRNDGAARCGSVEPGLARTMAPTPFPPRWRPIKPAANRRSIATRASAASGRVSMAPASRRCGVACSSAAANGFPALRRRLLQTRLRLR